LTAKDQIDIKILHILQNEFPLEEQPFLALAEQLGISESDVLERVAEMKASGLIRRIGGIFDSGRMGYYSTLCAVEVPTGRIAEVGQIINLLPGVTHNYLRDHAYNMWFTLTAASPEKAASILTEVEKAIGLPITSMPTQKVYKIKVSFEVGASHDD